MYIKELVAPKGYKTCNLSDLLISEYQVDDSGESEGHIAALEAASNDGVQEVHIKCVDTPVDDPLSVSITKYDSRTGESVPGGTGELNGAIFELRYYDNTEGDTSGTPKATWYFETSRKSSSFLFNARDDAAISYNGKASSAFYTGADGKRAYPLGTYVLKEVQAPRYYSTEGTYAIKGKEVGDTSTELVTILNQTANGGPVNNFYTKGNTSEAPLLIDTTNKMTEYGISVKETERRGKLNIVKKDGSNYAIPGVEYALYTSDKADATSTYTFQLGESEMSIGPVFNLTVSGSTATLEYKCQDTGDSKHEQQYRTEDVAIEIWETNHKHNSSGEHILTWIVDKGVVDGTATIGLPTSVSGSYSYKVYSFDCDDILYEGTFSLNDASSAAATYEYNGTTYYLLKTGTTDTNGELVFDDLIPTTYLLCETSVPSGYTLLKDPVEITVPYEMSSYNSGTYTEATDAAGAKYLYKTADTSKEAVAYWDVASQAWCFYQLTYNITNTPNFDMPMSGGNGFATPVVVATSCATLAAVAMYFFLKKRKTKTEAIAALGHSYDEGKVTKEATCTEKGEKTVTCTVCGDTKSESIPALGHDYDEGKVTKAATCTEKGEITYTCTRDKATMTKTIKATGHKWDEGKVTKEATCSTSGVMTYTCTNDGCNATKTKVIPATDEHDYKATAQKAATCTKDGSTTYTCSTCGDSYIETVKATGHNWGESTVTTAATCRRAGITTSACTNDGCNATRTEEIAALGHSWDEGKVTKAATCTQNGVKTYTCTRDGATKTETIKAYGSHSYQVTDSKDPTCTEDGYKTYTCANCGDSYTETIETSGHNWGTTAYTLLDGSKPLITYPRFEVTTLNNNKTHPAYIESPTKMTLTEWRNSDQADELNVKRHFFVGTNEDGTFKVAYGTLEDIMGEYPSDTQFSWTVTQEWNQVWTFNGETLMYYANPRIISGHTVWVTGTEERLFYNYYNEDGTNTEEYQYIVDLARRYGWDKIGETTEDVIQITLDSTTCETCGATK